MADGLTAVDVDVSNNFCKFIIVKTEVRIVFVTII